MKDDDIIEIVMSGRLGSREGLEALGRVAKRFATENSRMVRVLGDAGFEADADTAIMLILTALIMAQREGKLLGVLTFALKVAQLDGVVAKPDEIVETIQRKPEVLKLLASLFLGPGEMLVAAGTGADMPEPVRRMLDAEARRRTRAESGIELFPWLKDGEL